MKYTEKLNGLIEAVSDVDLTPPESAKNNAKKALEWKDKYGDEVKGGTAVGWTRARQLADGGALSPETVKRMASFARHRKNAEVDPKYKEEPWKDAGYVAWLIWGGTSGVDWAIRKSAELDRKKEKLDPNKTQWVGTRVDQLAKQGYDAYDIAQIMTDQLRARIDVEDIEKYLKEAAPQTTLSGAKVLKQIGKWTIEEYDGPSGRKQIAVTDGWYVDYPVSTDTGPAWDRPEKVPQAVKTAVSKLMQSRKFEKVTIAAEQMLNDLLSQNPNLSPEQATEQLVAKGIPKQDAADTVLRFSQLAPADVTNRVERLVESVGVKNRYKNVLAEAMLVDDIYKQIAKDPQLLDDRREYDVEEYMAAYNLSRADAERLYKKVQHALR